MARSVSKTAAAGCSVHRITAIAHYPAGDEEIAITDNQDGTYSFTMPDANVTVSASFGQVVSVTYLEENGQQQTENCNVICSGDEVLTGGFWTVTADTTVSERIEVIGNVYLVLCDNTTLSAPLGIHLTGDGNSLTIYAQSTGDNAGSLTVDRTPDFNAGIGGGSEGAGGNVTVTGGQVTATGDLKSTGVGSGAGYIGAKTGTLTLSLSGEDDFFTASSYKNISGYLTTVRI